MALNSGTRLGPYEVVSPLGAGGMGEVYRARDTRLERLVAVKVLPQASSAQALERFEREAKAIAGLNHPGICPVYDVGTSPIPFLVMELLDGETLDQRVRRGPINVNTMIETGLALADALSAAHVKGVIHRDLKPANIFVTPHGPKILDFGLARISEPVASVEVQATVQPTLATQGSITDAGVTVGTVAYMSPEQLRGEALDARSDLFSLGLVLYEMAAGRRAFSGATSAALSAAILHDQPIAPRQHRPEIPARLEQAILTLLEKDRDVRTQTASELRAELTRIKRDPSGSSRPGESGSGALSAASAPANPFVVAAHTTSAASSSDAQIAAGLVNRHRLAVIAALAVLLLVVAGAGYLVSRPAADTASDASGARPSITDLTVDQLTTSGTAGTPVISPDGKYVAYVEQGLNGDSLRVRQVATGSNVEILAEEPGVRLLAPAVTPDGTFVNYLRRAAPQPPELWQIAFLGGPPRRVLTGIGSGVGFSPDGLRMAYVRANGVGLSEVVVAASDGSGAQVLAARQAPKATFWTMGAAGGVGWFPPAWSPDGATIGVLGAADGTGEVVFIDTNTGAERSFDVQSPLPGVGLAWLDGETVLLSMLDRSSAPIQLWLLSYPQGQFSRLTNDVSQYIGVNLTADRSQLVTARSESSFSIWTSDGAAATWTQTVATTPVKGPIGFGVRWLVDDLIFPSSASGGWALERWRSSTRTTEILAPASGSPQAGDGSWFAYLNYDTSELWKVDADGRNKVLVRRGMGGSAQITPDGKQFIAVGGDPGKPPALYLSSVGADDARVIVSDRIRAIGGTVSPDGKLLGYGSTDDNNQPLIVVCDFPRCVSKRTYRAPGARAWMPDSKGFAYIDPRTRLDIWVQPIDGGQPRQLTRFPADRQEIWDFAWSADGKRLAVARGSIKNNILLMKGLRSKR